MSCPIPFRTGLAKDSFSVASSPKFAICSLVFSGVPADKIDTYVEEKFEIASSAHKKNLSTHHSPVLRLYKSSRSFSIVQRTIPLVFSAATMNVPAVSSTGSFQGTNTAESSDLPIRRQDSPRISRRPPTMYHPLVRSMVSSNTMKDCHQVKDMHSQCMVSGTADESYVCRTAKRYHAACEEFEK
jgi:hypothetical protein